MKTSALLATAALVSLPLTPVFACSTCLCGDPTLTQFGTEKPFAGRKRVSLEVMTRGESFGAGAEHHEIEETRTTLGFSYAYSERWLFGARMPWSSRELEHADGDRDKADGIGDLDLSAKWFLQPEEGVARKDAWGLQFNLRTPTAQRQKVGGQALDFDVQPGTDSWGGGVGAFYGHTAAPWFYYASAITQFIQESDIGNESFEPGNALALTALAQYALNPRVSLKLSLDGRISERDREDGESDPDSGGFFAFASPGIVVMPVEDLLLDLTVQIPAINALNGEHEETTAVRLAVTYDF